MKQQLSRALLAGVLGLGVMAGLLRADGPAAVPAAQTPMPVYYEDGSPAGYMPCPADGDGATAGKEAKKHPVCSWLKGWFNVAPERTEGRHPIRDLYDGCGCQHNNNDFGCSTIRSDLHFIFGSCRDFFGDPCQKGPPPAYTGVPRVPYERKIPQPYERNGLYGPNGAYGSNNGGYGSNGSSAADAGRDCNCK
jgi:hypothetical protein